MNVSQHIAGNHLNLDRWGYNQLNYSGVKFYLHILKTKPIDKIEIKPL